MTIETGLFDGFNGRGFVKIVTAVTVNGGCHRIGGQVEGRELRRGSVSKGGLRRVAAFARRVGIQAAGVALVTAQLRVLPFQRDRMHVVSLADHGFMAVLLDGVQERMADVAIATENVTGLIDVFSVVAAKTPGR